MPARKPSTLNTRNDTKADREERSVAESAMRPKTALTLKPPGVLVKHKVAAATWKRVVGLYAEVDGTIATSFDEDLLVKYCLLEEEVIGLATMRDDVLDDMNTNRKTAKTTKDVAEKMKLYEIVNALRARYQGLDARLDGKRKLLLAMAQSLYLTPRSRAGVAPPEKEPPKPKSKMGALLNEEEQEKNV